MTKPPIKLLLDENQREIIVQIIRNYSSAVSESEIETFLGILDELYDDYESHLNNPLLTTTSNQRSKLLYRISRSMNRSAEQIEFLLGRTDLQLAFVTAFHRRNGIDVIFPVQPDGTNDVFVNSLDSLQARLIFLHDQIAFLDSYAENLAASHKNEIPIPRKNAPLHFMADDLARALFFILSVDPTTSPNGLYASIFREMRRIVTKGKNSSDDVSTYVEPAVRTFCKDPE